MSIGTADRLFAPPRRRSRLPLVSGLLCIALLGAGLGLWRLATTERSGFYTRPGVGAELELVVPSRLPDWAREAIHDQQLGADHHFLATIVDLNRDEQPEILLVPARPRPDLFIPDSPLRVLIHEDGAWRSSEANRSCRPHRLGSFVTRGWWDLPCRDGTGKHVLRWDGDRYRAAK